jgi:hypothetical protein
MSSITHPYSGTTMLEQHMDFYFLALNLLQLLQLAHSFQHAAWEYAANFGKADLGTKSIACTLLSRDNPLSNSSVTSSCKSNSF